MSEATDPERIAQATRRGLSWNLASALATNVVRIGVVAILGRVLDSNAFGIVAAALSVTVFFYSVRDIGVGRAIVQRKELDPAHLQTAFSVSVLLGFGISGALLLAAPALGRMYRIADAIDVLRALSLLFAMRGVSITSRMMCQRAMRFRTIAIVDQVSFIAGSITSVCAALGGAGPWALVAGYLVEEALAGATYLVLSPPPFRLGIDRQKLRELMQFGAGETVSQIVATLATYGDNYVVGHALGAQQLGYYTRAYDLIKFPSIVFDSIAGSVLFPMFSRFQADRARLAIGLRRALFLNALVLGPASAALVVVAPEAIRLLMGAGWESSVLPFRILAVTILMRTSWKVGTIVAGAAGKIRGVALVNTAYMVVVVGGALLSIEWGIVGVASTTAVAITLAFMGTTYLAMDVSGLPLRDVLTAHGPGAAGAVVIGAVSWIIASTLRDQLHPAIVFSVVAVVSGGMLSGLVALSMRSSSSDFAWLKSELLRLRGRRPPTSPAP